MKLIITAVAMTLILPQLAAADSDRCKELFNRVNTKLASHQRDFPAGVFERKPDMLPPVKNLAGPYHTARPGSGVPRPRSQGSGIPMVITDQASDLSPSLKWLAGRYRTRSLG